MAKKHAMNGTVDRRKRRALGVLAITLLVSTAVPALTAAPAPADTRLCTFVDVPESSSGTVVNTLKPGESLTVTPAPAAKIWAGVWLTGENGPEGWNSTAPWDFPLPGVRSYSLIGKLGGGSWTYIGKYSKTFKNTSSNSQTLYARVNDNVPGNGSGAFSLNWCF